MKFKFEDKVKIETSDFYTGAEGIITNYDKIDDRYEVQLAYGCSRWFYVEQLKKVTTYTNDEVIERLEKISKNKYKLTHIKLKGNKK